MGCRQHLSLLRDVEIVVVNALTPWGNNHVIPRGPMWEPLTALNRADIVVIHNTDLVSEMHLKKIESTVRDHSPTCTMFFSKLAPSHIFEVNQPLWKLPLHVLDGMIVLCVSAIGCPDAFVRRIREDLELIQETVRKLVDQNDNKEAVVLITEKDYDRDPNALRTLDSKVWVLSSTLQIMPL